MKSHRITKVCLAVALAGLALPVAAQNTVTIIPDRLDFTHQTGSPAPAAKQLTLFSNPSGLAYTATAVNPTGQNWLSVGAGSSATTPAVLPVAVNPDGLATGVYEGQIVITATGVSPAPAPVRVTLTIQSTPTLVVSPENIEVTYQLGGAVPPQGMTIAVSSTGPAIPFTAAVAPGAAWLGIVPDSSTTPSAIRVGINPAGLPEGVHTAAITITSTTTPVITRQVMVKLTVSPNPAIEATPRALVFNYQTGGAPPAGQTVVVNNVGPQLPFTATASVGGSVPWLSVTPSTARTPGAIHARVNPQTLAPGVYNGAITIAAAGIAGGQEIVPVTLVVSSNALLNVARPFAQFQHQLFGVNPPAQTIEVTATSGSLPFSAFSTASWLIVSPGTGTAPSALTLSVNPTGLSPGTHIGQILIGTTNPTSVPLAIYVTLTISPTPLLVVDRPALNFNFVAGSAAPGPQAIRVTSTGAVLPFNAGTVESNGPAAWLVLAPRDGTTEGTLTLAVNTAGMADGVYTGLIYVTPPGAPNAPILIPVTLTVSNSQALVVEGGPLSFTQVSGGAAPASQVLRISTRGTVVNFSAVPSVLTPAGTNWLDVQPRSGTTPRELQVTVSASGLPPSNDPYTGTILISSTDPGVAPVGVPVSFRVSPSASLSVSATTATFSAIVGGSAPAAQPITVSTSGPTLTVNATAVGTSGQVTWLSVDPATAQATSSTPAAFSLRVNPTGLAAGSYRGTVTFASPGSSNSPAVEVLLNVTAAAPIQVAAVTHAATGLPGGVSPGLIVTIWGTGMGPATGVGLQLNEQGLVATTLGGVRVLFDGIPVPVIYASASQINAVVSYLIAGRVTTRLEVEYQGRRSTPIELRVFDTVPGLFAGAGGQAAALNQNGSANSAANPADRDSVIVLFATGEGQTVPAGVDGRVNTAVFPRPLGSVSVTVGGVPALIEYAGAAPGLVSGVIQINARIATNVTPGAAVPVQLTVGGASSPPVATIAVR